MELSDFLDQNPFEFLPVRALKQQLRDRCGHPRFRLYVREAWRIMGRSKCGYQLQVLLLGLQVVINTDILIRTVVTKSHDPPSGLRGGGFRVKD